MIDDALFSRCQSKPALARQQFALATNFASMIQLSQRALGDGTTESTSYFQRLHTVKHLTQYACTHQSILHTPYAYQPRQGNPGSITTLNDINPSMFHHRKVRQWCCITITRVLHCNAAIPLSTAPLLSHPIFHISAETIGTLGPEQNSKEDPRLSSLTIQSSHSIRPFSPHIRENRPVMSFFFFFNQTSRSTRGGNIVQRDGIRPIGCIRGIAVTESFILKCNPESTQGYQIHLIARLSS